jgi:hypothetical protein
MAASTGTGSLRRPRLISTARTSTAGSSTFWTDTIGTSAVGTSAVGTSAVGTSAVGTSAVEAILDGDPGASCLPGPRGTPSLTAGPGLPGVSAAG